MASKISEQVNSLEVSAIHSFAYELGNFELKQDYQIYKYILTTSRATW